MLRASFLRQNESSRLDQVRIPEGSFDWNSDFFILITRNQDSPPCSGGKDSIYNLQLCKEQGHEV